MLKFTNKNFINNINKLYLKDKSFILYTILATLLFIENTIFFFDKEYKYNIFTILSLITIYLYFNSIKIAIITAILIINIYYLLYKNIYESFDEYAVNTACANLTGAIENVYNEKANLKYYEYCKLSGLKKSLHDQSNLILNGGVMYPYKSDLTVENIYSNNSYIAHDDDRTMTSKDVGYHRHDLSFRQWMIYNYESLGNNDISDNGSFLNELTTKSNPKDSAIFGITDAYIKNLQDRNITNCIDDTKYIDSNIDASKNDLAKTWIGYDDPDACCKPPPPTYTTGPTTVAEDQLNSGNDV